MKKKRKTLKDKKYYCKDCPKEINWYTALYRGGRCRSCATKNHWKIGVLKKGKNHPCYKDGRCSKKYFCPCGKEIDWQTALYKSNLCRSCSCKGKTGKKAGNWRNGITPLRKLIRNCLKYRLWRSDVFTVDDFTCRICNKRGGDLNVHHSPKSFSEIMFEYKIKTLEDALNCVELWNINNGITLCADCHKLVHKIKYKKKAR